MLSTDRLDRLFTADGDITINRSVTGIAGVAHRIRVRFQIFREEWFLNLLVGVPYFQELLGQKFRRAKVESILRKEMEQVQGVVQIRQLSVALEPVTRKLVVDFNVRTEFGDLLTSLTL